MAQQVIITTPENSGEGTPLATAFDYCNSNFSELYSRVQAPPPATLVGSVGDQAGMYAYDPTYFYYCYANYTGNSTIWAQLTQAGNISATQIQYGNSSVDIATPGANVTIAVNGSFNRVVFTNTTSFFNTTVFANGNLTVNGTTSVNSVQANGFINTSNTVSAVGNITTAGYFIGNGSQLTGVGGNANQIINGTSQVSIPTTDGNVYVDADGVSTLATFSNTGLEIAGNITATNIVGSLSTAAQPNIISVGTLSSLSVSGNVVGGNIHTGGLVSAVGNITGNYILGNGSQLTGIVTGSSYGNANVAAYLPTYTGDLSATNVNISGQVSIAGNVTVDYQSTINGTVEGQLYGLLNGVNEIYGQWDFGLIAANTYNNPMQWIFAQTGAGNIDMGTVTAPASINIDIGTIF